MKYNLERFLCRLLIGVIKKTQNYNLNIIEK